MNANEPERLRFDGNGRSLNDYTDLGGIDTLQLADDDIDVLVCEECAKVYPERPPVIVDGVEIDMCHDCYISGVGDGEDNEKELVTDGGREYDCAVCDSPMQFKRVRDGNDGPVAESEEFRCDNGHRGVRHYGPLGHFTQSINLKESSGGKELVTDGGVETLAFDESGRSLDDYTDLGGIDMLQLDDEDEDGPECPTKHCSQTAEYLIKETEKCKLPFKDTTVGCKRHAKRDKIRGYEILAFDGEETLSTDPWRSD